MHAWLAARRVAVRHQFALEGKALRQCPAEAVGAADVVGVVAFRFPAGGNVQHVMHVVVPLSVVQRAVAACPALQPSRLVVLVLKYQMRTARQRRAAHPLRQLLQDVHRAVIHDGVHRVEAQAVQVKLLEPVEGVMNEEFAHAAVVVAIEIDRRAPGCVMARIEELRCVQRQVIAFRAKVVVDHIQDHHQAARVRGVDQCLEVLRAAVGRVWGIGQYAVIAPVAAAGKIRDRHELEHRYPHLHQVVQSLDRSQEGAGLGETADMQFVDHGGRPRSAMPVAVLPCIVLRVDHFARAMYVRGLIARGGVGYCEPVGQDEAVARSGAGAIGRQAMPAVALALHR